MASPAKRRIMRDFKRIQEDPPEGISGSPRSVSEFSSNQELYNIRQGFRYEYFFSVTIKVRIILWNGTQ